MKRIALVLLLALPALADDAAVDALIDKLAADDASARQSAWDELVKRGAEAETRLKARRDAKDAEQRALIEKALAEIALEPLKKAQLVRGASVTATGGEARSAAWSPDGKLFASGGEAGDVVIWDAAKKRPIRTLTGHTHWVAAMAFSPDGKRLWSAGRTVIVWDVEKGEKVHEFEASHTTRVAVSADGRWGAWDEHGGIVAVADAKTFEEKERLSVPGDRTVPEAIVFSPDGKKLFVGNRGGRVRTWDVESGEKLSEEQLAKDEGGVQAIALLGGDKIFVATWNGTVHAGDKSLLLGKSIYSAAANADASRLAVALPDTGEVVLLDPELKELARWKAADRTSQAWAWSPDGKALLTDAPDGLRLWTDGKPEDLGGHAGPPTSFAFSGDSKWLAVSSAKRAAFLNVETGEKREIAAFGCVATAPGGVAVLDRAKAELRDPAKDAPLKVLRDGIDLGTSPNLFVSPDGSQLLRSVFMDGCRIYPAGAAPAPAMPEKFFDTARDAAWSPDSKLVAIAGVFGHHGEAGGLSIFGADGTMSKRIEADGGAITVAWAPDGKSLWWSERAGLHRLDPATGADELVAKGNFGWWRFLDATTALVHDGQKLSLWDVPSLRSLRTFDESAGWNGVEVSPDGKRVAFADAAGATVFELKR